HLVERSTHGALGDGVPEGRHRSPPSAGVLRVVLWVEGELDVGHSGVLARLDGSSARGLFAEVVDRLLRPRGRSEATLSVAAGGHGWDGGLLAAVVGVDPDLVFDNHVDGEDGKSGVKGNRVRCAA